MDTKHGITITTRDRLMRAWQNSTELVREFTAHAKELEEDENVAEVFAQYAEDEGFHASKFLEMLREYDVRQG